MEEGSRKERQAQQSMGSSVPPSGMRMEEGSRKERQAQQSMGSSVPPSGILPIPGANAVFLEPSLMLGSSYARFCLRPPRYYSRSYFYSSVVPQRLGKSKKRKLRQYALNAKEQRAQLRHQDVRQFLLDAHREFVALPDFPSLVKSLESCISSHRNSEDTNEVTETGSEEMEDVDFVKLAEVWQAPLFEIAIPSSVDDVLLQHGQTNVGDKQLEFSTSPLFNAIVENAHDVEILAECVGHTFLLPRRCRLLVSDLAQISRLIPGHPSDGYNVILIDPPWENKSVHRQSLYPTLPNRRLLALPLQKLAHIEGALVALWITNREKLRSFVEDMLFPAWGVINAGTWYWLKVRSSGEIISDLDLTHHRPYECLLLGYIFPGSTSEAAWKSFPEVDMAKLSPVLKGLPDRHVLISIPGDHSRKPPVGLLLSSYAPGSTTVRGLELFARELNADWTSWGNEPLHFQHTKYFTARK
eukprot:c24697_g1_i4 orf=45-1454(+)